MNFIICIDECYRGSVEYVYENPQYKPEKENKRKGKTKEKKMDNSPGY